MRVFLQMTSFEGMDSKGRTIAVRLGFNQVVLALSVARLADAMTLSQMGRDEVQELFELRL
jgi:hypothetical protein